MNPLHKLYSKKILRIRILRRVRKIERLFPGANLVLRPALDTGAIDCCTSYFFWQWNLLLLFSSRRLCANDWYSYAWDACALFPSASFSTHTFPAATHTLPAATHTLRTATHTLPLGLNFNTHTQPSKHTNRALSRTFSLYTRISPLNLRIRGLFFSLHPERPFKITGLARFFLLVIHRDTLASGQDLLRTPVSPVHPNFYCWTLEIK